jgi:hypothetical protein
MLLTAPKSSPLLPPCRFATLRSFLRVKDNLLFLGLKISLLEPVGFQGRAGKQTPPPPPRAGTGWDGGGAGAGTGAGGGRRLPFWIGKGERVDGSQRVGRQAGHQAGRRLGVAGRRLAGLMGRRIWQVGWLAGGGWWAMIRYRLAGPSLVDPLANGLGRQAQKGGAWRLPLLVAGIISRLSDCGQELRLQIY